MPEMSAYIESIIPKERYLKFIFLEDFNGDGRDEAIIGYSVHDEAYADLYVKYIFDRGTGYDQQDVLCTGEGDWNGAYDCAYTGDTNGDGRPEFILALGAGSGHFVVPYAFHLIDGRLELVWQAEEPYPNGYVLLEDIDGDGIYEIVVNSISLGEESEIIENPVRACICWKWDQKEYYPRFAGYLRPEEEALAAATAFLYHIWKGHNEKALEYAYLPCFLGIGGLGGLGSENFKIYADQELRPLLQRNLTDGKLKTEYDFSVYGGMLNGPTDSFYVEVLKIDSEYRVVQLFNYPRYEMPEDTVRKFREYLNWGELEKARDSCLEGLELEGIYSKYHDYPYSEDQLYLETTYQDETKAVVLSYYANLSLYTFAAPNRVLKSVLEFREHKWLITSLFDLDKNLPVKILHRSFTDKFGPKGESIFTEYPAHYLKPEKSEKMLLSMYDKEHEYVILQMDFTEIEFIDFTQELWLLICTKDSETPFKFRFQRIKTVIIDKDADCYFICLRG